MRWLMFFVVAVSSTTSLAWANDPFEWSSFKLDTTQSPVGVDPGALELCESDHTVIVVESGGGVTVLQDGQPVPAERIQRDGSRITIRSETGEKVTDIVVAGDRVDAIAAIDPRPPTRATKHKRVGITMVPVDASLCAHLDLDPDRVIMIGEVHEGLPASRAGLQQYDIITQVNDAASVDLQTVQAAVQATPAGGELRLTILRRGVAQTARVGVEEVELVDRPAEAPPAAGDWARFLGTRLYATSPRAASTEGPLLARTIEGLRVLERAEAGDPRQTIFALELEARAAAEREAARQERATAAEAVAVAQRGTSMKRVEERLERLEQMLEQLLKERAGGGR